MPDASLFHLHFNTPDVAGAAERLEAAGVPLDRRFGAVRGESVSLAPGEESPDGFRFRLQVHQRGRVNVTLAPGRRPRFDHLGVVVDGFEAVLDRATSRGWSVRRSERRTFLAPPWDFRVEVHPPDADVVAALGSAETARIDAAVLETDAAEAVRTAFDDVFGGVRGLTVAPGAEPWITSFDVVTEAGRAPLDVRTLLETAGSEG